MLANNFMLIKLTKSVFLSYKIYFQIAVPFICVVTDFHYTCKKRWGYFEVSIYDHKSGYSGLKKGALINWWHLIKYP